MNSASEFLLHGANRHIADARRYLAQALTIGKMSAIVPNGEQLVASIDEADRLLGFACRRIKEAEDKLKQKQPARD
jgi:hypothetical protein